MIKKFYDSGAGGAGGVLAGLAGLAGGAGPWGMALSAIPALINIFGGAKTKEAGEDMAAANRRPIVGQQFIGQYKDMLQFMEKQAQYGLDPSTMAWQLQQTNQGLTRSLNAMLQAGGNPNAATDVLGTYSDALGKIGSVDSQLRTDKVLRVEDAMEKVIGADKERFMYDEDAPYKDTAQLASAKQQAGLTQEQQGLDTLSSAGMALLSSPYKIDANNNDNTNTVTRSSAAQAVSTGAINTATDVAKGIGKGMNVGIGADALTKALQALILKGVPKFYNAPQ